MKIHRSQNVNQRNSTHKKKKKFPFENCRFLYRYTVNKISRVDSKTVGWARKPETLMDHSYRTHQNVTIQRRESISFLNMLLSVIDKLLKWHKQQSWKYHKHGNTFKTHHIVYWQCCELQSKISQSYSSSTTNNNTHILVNYSCIILKVLIQSSHGACTNAMMSPWRYSVFISSHFLWGWGRKIFGLKI